MEGVFHINLKIIFMISVAFYKFIVSHDLSDFISYCRDSEIKQELDDKTESYNKLNSLQILTVNELFYLSDARENTLLEENTKNNINRLNNLEKEEALINEIILNNCDIRDNWKSENSNFYKILKTNFEEENIPQRTFRIKYHNKENLVDAEPHYEIDSNYNSSPKIKEFITINKIELKVENFISVAGTYSDDFNNYKIPKLSGISKFPLILEEGDSYDFFINYNCDRYIYLSEWFNIKIDIQIEDKYSIQFDYVKICSFKFKKRFNFTYLFLILLFLSVSYLCEKDILIFNVHIIKINVEEIVHFKYAELILIVILIIAAVLILLAILGIFTFAVYIAGFLLSLISIKFLLKSLIALVFPVFDNYASNNKWNVNIIPGLATQVSLSKIIYYICSFCILSLWLFYFNDIFLANFISFAISYLLIKKITFNNFYLIIALYVIVIIYDIIYMIIWKNIYFGEYFMLSSVLFVNIPVKFLIPEIISTPFKTNYFFSIMDVILVGFITEYLKKYYSIKKDRLILKYGRYGLFLGLGFNLLFFYAFNMYFPFFFWPGLFLIMIVTGYTIWNKQFYKLVYIEIIEEHYNLPNKNFIEINEKEKLTHKKISIPMKIFTTDQSEDFKKVNSTPVKKKYTPPPFSIKEEYEDGKEESPTDITFKNSMMK